MDITPGSNVSWLTTCPSSDGNFTNHLACATAEEIRQALDAIRDKPYTKSKVAILERALRRRIKEENAAASKA